MPDAIDIFLDQPEDPDEIDAFLDSPEGDADFLTSPNQPPQQAPVAEPGPSLRSENLPKKSPIEIFLDSLEKDTKPETHPGMKRIFLHHGVARKKFLTSLQESDAKIGTRTIDRRNQLPSGGVTPIQFPDFVSRMDSIIKDESNPDTRLIIELLRDNFFKVVKEQPVSNPVNVFKPDPGKQVISFDEAIRQMSDLQELIENQSDSKVREHLLQLNQEIGQDFDVFALQVGIDREKLGERKIFMDLINSGLFNFEKSQDEEGFKALINEGQITPLEKPTDRHGILKSPTGAGSRPDGDARKGELGVLKRPGGGISTELSITIQVQELNQGRPTNIPLLVKGQVDVNGLLSGNRPTDQQMNIAIGRALERVAQGQELPSFDSIEEAVASAQQRSDRGGSLQKNQFFPGFPERFSSVESFQSLPDAPAEPDEIDQFLDAPIEPTSGDILSGILGTPVDLVNTAGGLLGLPTPAKPTGGKEFFKDFGRFGEAWLKAVSGQITQEEFQEIEQETGAASVIDKASQLATIAAVAMAVGQLGQAAINVYNLARSDFNELSRISKGVRKGIDFSKRVAKKIKDIGKYSSETERIIAKGLKDGFDTIDFRSLQKKDPKTFREVSDFVSGRTVPPDVTPTTLPVDTTGSLEFPPATTSGPGAIETIPGFVPGQVVQAPFIRRALKTLGGEGGGTDLFSKLPDTLRNRLENVDSDTLIRIMELTGRPDITPPESLAPIVDALRFVLKKDRPVKESAVKDELSISKTVQKLGGIDTKGVLGPEVEQQLSRKELGGGKLINKLSGLEPDRMLASVQEAGFPVENVDQLIEEVKKDFLKPKAAEAHEFVTVGDLAEGDKFKVEGIKSQVIGRDKDDNVIIEDSTGAITKHDPFERIPIQRGEAGITKGKVLKPELLREKVPVKRKTAAKRRIREITGQVKALEIKELREQFKRDVEVSKVAFKAGTEVSKVKETVVRPPSVKARIREITGQIKAGKLIFDERTALNTLLRRTQAAAKTAFAAGRREGVSTQKVHQKRVEAAKKLRDELKKEINGIVAKVKKQPSQSLPVEYKEAIEEIKKNFDFKRRTRKTLSRRAGTRDFIKRQKEQGNVISIPQKTLDLMDKKPLNDLTIDELREVGDAVEQLVHVGRTKNRLLKIQKAKEFRQVKRDVTEPMDKVKGVGVIPPGVGVTEASKKKFLRRPIKRSINEFIQSDLRMERILLRLDNYVEDGPNQKAIFQPVEEATNKSLKAQQGDFALIEKGIKLFDLNPNKLITKRRKINKTKELSGEEMIEVAIAVLDEDKLRHLKEGNGFSDKDIEDTFKAMTKEEKQYAAWEIANYWFPQYQKINPAYRAMFNNNLPRIENYSHIAIDFDVATKQRQDVLAKDLTKELFGRDTLDISFVERGFTKERNRGAIAPLNLRHFDNLYKNIQATNHFIAFAETARDLKKLVNDPEYIKAVSRSAGPETHKIISKWLDNVISQNISSDPGKLLNRMVRTVRNHSAVAMLGLNMVTAMKQPVSFLNATALIGSPAVLNGIQQYLRNPKGLEKFVFERSPQLKDRSVERDIAELMRQGRVQGVFGVKNRLSVKSMALLRAMDKYTVVSTWKGAYDKVLHKNPNNEEAAIREAEKMIRRTQPAYQIKDLPAFFRGGELEKMLTMYMNQRNQNWNFLVVDIIGKTFAGKISRLEGLRRFLWLVSAGITIGAVSRGRTQNTKEEISADIANVLVGGMFFGGPLMSAYIQGYNWNIPIQQPFRELGWTINSKKIPTKVRHGIATLSYILKLPLNFLSTKFIPGLLDLLTGRTRDLRRLMFSARQLKEPKKTIKRRSVTGG
jgi:hypothetical protein